MAKLFDYINQAWTVDGFYLDCSHPEAGTRMGDDGPAPGEEFPGCDCYGRAHAGEAVPEKLMHRMMEEQVEGSFAHKALHRRRSWRWRK